MDTVSERLNRKERLRRPWEFALVRRKGVSVRGRYLVLVALYGDETSERRIGIITGKRVGCSAVRNRVRRRLREVYRKNRRFARKDGWLVLIARSSARLATYQDLVSEFLTLLSRC